MKIRKLQLSVLLAATLLCACLAGAAWCAQEKSVRGPAGPGEVRLSKQEAKRLDVFFSNFAEAGLSFFALDQAGREELLNFGVEHMLINGGGSLRSIGGGRCGVPAARVKAAVKKYFGRELTPAATRRYPLRTGYYIAGKAGGEAFKFAQIISLEPAGKGLFKAVVKLYTASSGFTGDSHGGIQQWKKSDPENIPSASGTVKALISCSRTEPGRYLLRAYQRAD